MYKYLGVTIFCFVFQVIYGIFSHDVSSNYMTFAFMIPLVGGIIGTASFIRPGRTGNAFFRQCINGAVAWLTLGSIFQGVLEIYGTTNHKVVVFAIVGGLHILAALIFRLRRG